MDSAEMSVVPNPLCLEGNVHGNWQKFKREFTDYLISIEFDKKPDEVKAAKLRNVIGDDGRQKILSLGLEKSVDYCDMMKTLDDWAETQRNPTHVRLKFYGRTQNEDESFENFFKDVKHLSLQCNFGTITEELLRDKVVTGILNCPLKELFSATPEISLETAVQMCRTADLSEEQLHKLLLLKRKEKQNNTDDHKVSDMVFDSNLNSFTKEKIEESINDCAEDYRSQPTVAGENLSEATFRLIVKSVSKLREARYSRPYYVRNLPWKIMALQKTTPDVRKYLGVYLVCNRNESKDSSWSCSAKAELTLLPQEQGKKPLSREIEHVFSHGINDDWGFSAFIAWEDLLNPETGYIKEDSIILETHISADAPRLGPNLLI